MKADPIDTRAEAFYKIYVYDITKRIAPLDTITLMEMFAKQEIEQFWIWVHKNKSQDQRLRYSFTELFNDWLKEQEEQKCSECGKSFHKSEIIIKGDIDTCDDCLCPE